MGIRCLDCIARRLSALRPAPRWSRRHTAALRNTFNRLLGILYHCLRTRQTYDEHKAFPALVQDMPAAA